MSLAHAPTQSEKRSFSEGLRRGLAGRCPNCGEGGLFSGYLKVEPQCEVCGHDLSQYRADDGPAYFTILIVGHLFVAPLLCFSFIWTWNPILVVALTLPSLLAVTLILLPRVKGAFIGGQWATNATPYT
ncbi:MAG: DUF983 domain-containing protein [Caulobacteraceae bacterium]